ncbi:UPF0585 protein [Nymphon striatum]|nr:UPF0585 protein [Nymphon striatum]
MPLYAKTNTYGEFVFDHAWADAYHRNQIPYFPKLVSSIPYTPASGQRLLCKPGRADELYPILIETIQQFSEKQNYSSFHCLFANTDEQDWLENYGLLARHDCQFHWHNQGYETFEDFLAKLTPKKRKNIRQERRRVAQQAVNIRVLDGHTATDEDWENFSNFYQQTFAEKYGTATLNEGFFKEVAHALPDQVILVLADDISKVEENDQNPKGECIAGSLMFASDTILYGRHWGCIEQIDKLHFEACYYQGIEYCIKHKLKKFEPGAQGEHKIARGIYTDTYAIESLIKVDNLMSFQKPFSESCIQNQQVILDVLIPLLKDKKHLLEIGSGTGQHAVFFAKHLPHLVWQTSDQHAYHEGIKLWLNEANLSNTRPPLSLNVSEDPWPDNTYDSIFSANAVHIMSWDNVVDYFKHACPLLESQGYFILYGPFNYNGKYTSESNARFDQWLKSNDPMSCIKDFEELNALAKAEKFEALVAFWLNISPNYKLIQQNIQIIEDGITFGEIDFIIQEVNSGKIIHLEVCVKFYLGTDPYEDSYRWFGTNTKDQLGRKLDHLLHHQSQLKNKIAPKGISSHHLRGSWMYGKDIAESKTTYLALNKTRWLSELNHQDIIELQEKPVEIFKDRIHCYIEIDRDENNNFQEKDRVFFLPDEFTFPSDNKNPL